MQPIPRIKSCVASQFHHSLEKDMLRRSNEPTGGGDLVIDAKALGA
jgi:hypothetical protein